MIVKRKEIARLIYDKGLDALRSVKQPFLVRGQLIEALLRPSQQLAIMKISARRYIVLLVEVRQEWQSLDSELTAVVGFKAGYTLWGAKTVSAEPVSFQKAREIASAFAVENHLVISHNEYEADARIMSSVLTSVRKGQT